MAANIEIEKKYIILKPRISDMERMDGFEYSDIVQIYLSSERGQTHRIRSRTYPTGRVEYTETVKHRIDKMSAFEDERSIDEETFRTLSSDILEGTSPITKRRYTFEYSSQKFEIDIYPQYKNTCVMETELDKRDLVVEMPPFIRIIADVTGDRRYSNASMSREFPPEPKVE